MTPASDKPATDMLYVRPVVEEFKAFVQHKIEVLERFKNVDEIKVYLDALELGVRAILDLQMEDAADLPPSTEIEFKGEALEPDRDEQDEGLDDTLAEEEEAIPEDRETGPGIETEELETREGDIKDECKGGEIPEHQEEVLVGEDGPLDPDAAVEGAGAPEEKAVDQEEKGEGRIFESAWDTGHNHEHDGPGAVPATGTSADEEDGVDDTAADDDDSESRETGVEDSP